MRFQVRVKGFDFQQLESLMKLSHGEVKSINNPMQIRMSKFEIAAPGMFGRTPFKFDFAKMSISEISAIKQNSLKKH